MNRLVRVALVLVAALSVGCLAAGPGTEAPGGEGGGTWSYATGPHGEKCLFYSEGAGNTFVLAMHCDGVRP